MFQYQCNPSAKHQMAVTKAEFNLEILYKLIILPQVPTQKLWKIISTQVFQCEPTSPLSSNIKIQQVLLMEGKENGATDRFRK